MASYQALCILSRGRWLGVVLMTLTAADAKQVPQGERIKVYYDRSFALARSRRAASTAAVQRQIIAIKIDVFLDGTRQIGCVLLARQTESAFRGFACIAESTIRGVGCSQSADEPRILRLAQLNGAFCQLHGP